MRRTLILAPVALLAAGCSGGEAGDTGDAAAATAASAKTIKTPDQLPKDMPPAARKSAEGAMMAGEAMKAQQEAQMEAMKKATQGAH